MKRNILTSFLLLSFVILPLTAEAKRKKLRRIISRDLETYCRNNGAGVGICPKFKPPCADLSDKARENGPTRPANVDCKP